MMVPGPSLKWVWMSSLVTAGRSGWSAVFQKDNDMARGPSDLLSWFLKDQDVNKCLVPYSVTVSPPPVLTRRRVERDTGMWDYDCVPSRGRLPRYRRVDETSADMVVGKPGSFESRLCEMSESQRPGVQESSKVMAFLLLLHGCA